MRRYRDVTDTDEDRRIARDGDVLRFPMALMDHNQLQKGEAKMDDNDTVMIDGQTMSRDAAIEHLQGKVAALEAQVPVVDAAIAARDAARLRARDALLAQQAGKHNDATSHGAYVGKLRDSWKSGQSWR